jgi:hypothetical protein
MEMNSDLRNREMTGAMMIWAETKFHLSLVALPWFTSCLLESRARILAIVGS